MDYLALIKMFLLVGLIFYIRQFG